MKKTLTLAMAAVLGLSAIPMNVSASNDLVYDFNLDGTIDRHDARTLELYFNSINNSVTTRYGETFEITDESRNYISENGDVNGDGEINFDDFYAYYNYLAENEFVNFDFNCDGVYDSRDIHTHICYYAERQTSNYTILTDEQRTHIEEFGDLYITRGEFYAVNGIDNSVLLSIYHYNIESGDIDRDGSLTGTDASAILGYYAKAQTDKLEPKNNFNEEELRISYLGDYNNDYNIDGSDVSFVLAKYAKAQTNQS